MNLFFPSSDTLSVMPELHEFDGIYSFTLNIVNSCAAPGREVKVRCPLCNTRTTAIYCVDCINTGRFSHSKGGYDERLVSTMYSVVNSFIITNAHTFIDSLTHAEPSKKIPAPYFFTMTRIVL